LSIDEEEQEAAADSIAKGGANDLSALSLLEPSIDLPGAAPRPPSIIEEKPVGYQTNRVAFGKLPIPDSLKKAIVEAHNLGHSDFVDLVEKYGEPDKKEPGPDDLGIHGLKESEKWLDAELEKPEAHVPADPSLLD